jgi:hypothetical protein
VEQTVARLLEPGEAPAREALAALAAEAGARLSWDGGDASAPAAWLADRLARLRRLERAPRRAARGPERAPVRGATDRTAEPLESAPAERAAHAAWLWLEACGAAFDPGEPAARALRMFDELRLREPLASALRAHGAEGDHAWRLAARVRALLAHGGAETDGASWQAFLADEDARFAAGLTPGDMPRVPPAWWELPARLEKAVTAAE